MKMFLAGRWVDSPVMTPITRSFNGEQVDEVPEATGEQVEQALAAAVKGAAAMAALTASERSQILMRAADLLAQKTDDFARTISLEEGKPLSEAQGEAARTPDLLRLCAFEGSQLRGETLPVDAQAGVRGKFGMTVRIPCGVVVAITPFNYPLLLVAHKVGPALAAGNAVILKPAEQTPLTALKFTRILAEAGLPENAIQCITGSGPRVGSTLCADERVRKITFTGSTQVGQAISRIAGVKRLSMELGSNAPLVVMPDADLNQVADATALSGYVNAGQVCISTQRVLVHHKVYADFISALKPKVEAIKAGDPFVADTKLSAMVSQKQAVRVDQWVQEAVAAGARLVSGGKRDNALYPATIVADVKPTMRLYQQELFGPAVALTSVDSIDEAIFQANNTGYGLSAAIFTKNLNHAMRFSREVQSGNIMINSSPLWRADLIPYGGLKQSGVGKEGPRYAVQEMTETKTVVLHDL